MSTDNDTSSRQMTVALAAVGTLAQLSPAQLATFAGANVAEAIDISGDNSKDELAHKNDGMVPLASRSPAITSVVARQIAIEALN